MKLSRRDLLRLFFGLPLAVACKNQREGVPGSIRGANVGLAHRLRDATVERAAGKAESVTVAIVGAGPGGLVAARRLRQSGLLDFVLFDLEGQSGGSSCYGTDGVVSYPWGAHYLPQPDDENRPLREFIAEIGGFESDPVRGEVIREDWLVRAPEERLFARGRWHAGLSPATLLTHEDRLQLARFQRKLDHWVAWRDGTGKRAFAVPMRRSSAAAEVRDLDRISAAEWLAAEGLDSSFLRWYVDYACRDDYGLRANSTSAWAMLFYFTARTPRAGAPSAPFLTWPEGNGYLVRRLTEPLGSRLKLDALVTDVAPTDQGVALSVFDARQGALKRYDARYVILAVPQFVAARILRPLREARPTYLDEFSYSPWLVANLHLDSGSEAEGPGGAWDNVLFDSPSLGYVSATHQTLRERGPTVWTYYNALVDAEPNVARNQLYGADHESLANAVLGDLGRAVDVRRRLSRLDVWRWGHAMVSPRVGFMWGGGRERAAEPRGRVFFAHTDLSGMALFEESFDRGEQAANQILARLRHGAG